MLWHIFALERQDFLRANGPLVFFYQPPGSATVLTKHLMSNKVVTPAEQ